MTEESIVMGCQQKEPAAQEALYLKFSSKMLGVCYRFAHNRQDAEDMLQEGFVKIFLQINRYEHRGSLEGWILRVIVHTCINHLKKYKKFNDVVDLAYASNLIIREDSIPGIVQAKQIVESIRALPIGYRTVLNLYAIEGYSHKEIGSMLEIEESTSRSQYTRAKNLLEEILSKKEIIQPKDEKRVWLKPVSQP
jgi:RNA polymerase sigma-70 factor (ECF subfamily)